tara:strand:- start:288 stop:485 length:198 start_codon:yes stop_codon:yes gene_type:complete
MSCVCCIVNEPVKLEIRKNYFVEQVFCSPRCFKFFITAMKQTVDEYIKEWDEVEELRVKEWDDGQ